MTDKKLDRLLGGSAVLADSGFTDEVSKRLRHEKPLSDNQRQPRLFGLVGGIWLVLAIAAGVPRQIQQWLAAYREWFAELAREQLPTGIELTLFGLQSAPLLFMAVAVAVTFALVSVLRD